jgi:carbonic anhydrase
VSYSERCRETDPGDFIDNWMSLIAPAAEAIDGIENLARADYFSRLEQASIVVTLTNLLSFPWIRRRVEEGQLQLLGAYFDVGTGELKIHRPDTADFAPVAEATAPQPAGT